MIGQTSYSYAREAAAVHSLRALKPAAVFFTGVVELEDNRQFLRELGVPVVESWAFPRDPIDMLVGISNTDGERMAAEHLVSRGHRRLAFVGRSGGRGRLRLKGFEALPIPPNYWDDVEARFGLEPEFSDRLRSENILYDRDEHGEYFQLYAPTWGEGFIFEIVERRNGYRGYGAANAPFRIAAQKRQLRPGGMPLLRSSPAGGTSG